MSVSTITVPTHGSNTPRPNSQPAPKPLATPADPHAIQRAYLTRHIGKNVRFRTMDGKAFTGRLLGFDQFSLLVAVGEDTRLVYKQAIAMIGETTEAEGGTK